MSTVSLEALKPYAAEFKTVPVYKTIFSDVRTPLSVMKALKKVNKTVFLLESADNQANWGRYSFLGFKPSLEITCKNSALTVTDRYGRKESTTDNPNAAVREILKEYAGPQIPGLPTFTGGLVGYFAYEYSRYGEKTLYFKDDEPDHGISFNDVDLMLFDTVVAFDHNKKVIYLIRTIKTDNLEANYEAAKQELDELAQLVACGEYWDVPRGKLLTGFEDEFDRAAFIKEVEKLQHHIKEGDIFQAVLSNGRSAKFEGSLFNAYRVLRTTNPSPYMFYLSSPDLELTGASPETLVKVTGRRLDTFPIAGTMPRGATPEEDKALEERLIHDEKELAEHNMLVDLGRNDIGRVSQFGSVKVEELRQIHRFSHVMHICSSVTGTLRDDKDALDALQATLPAGTMSGAPKIRAMELIHAAEPTPRGVYAGAIGYLDFSGNMDMCIGIRMAVSKGGRVFVRAGAGIVKDSVPDSEYTETRNKAQSMIDAITKAQEVTDYDIAY